MWYNKYISALGDPARLTPAFFEGLSRAIVRLGHDSPPLVSVVIIARNEQERLGGCLWSLSESRSESRSEFPVEIIVVDNGSTDHTAQIIRQSGARYIFQPLKGVGHARQAGLEAARGEYIISADADTLYGPHYIDTMIRHLRKPATAAVFTTYWFMTDGKKSRLSLDLYSALRDLTAVVRSIKRPELAAGGAAMAFRREDALRVGWKTDIRRGEDGSMIVELKRFGKIRLVLSRHTRVRSTSRTLDADGGWCRMVAKRIAREVRRSGAYFTSKPEYKDQDYNKL